MKTMDDILERNVAEILPSKEAFAKRLEEGPIKIYLGIDPSATEIHIGNAVVLWKLRELQDTGHKVILLIGDFTGMIGDPTDRSAARKKMTQEEVLENAKTYKEQVSKILRFDGENPAEFKFNSEWLSKLTFKDVVELASNLTVQQMIERDFFQRRIKETRPIYLHEFLYPLMQGYDSVAMDVDAEIGGTDQTFNMLIGRTLMKALKGKEKFVVSVPLLEGLDGRKMSKSFNNYIAVTDNPSDMFGKVMSINDELIPRYFELATRLPKDEVQTIEEGLHSGKVHPLEAKKRLAREIVRIYHGEEAADKAQSEFEKVFKEGGTPDKAPVYKASGSSVDLLEALTSTELVESKSEARRLLEQGALEWNGEKVKEPTLRVEESGTLRVGKYRFLKIEKT